SLSTAPIICRKRRRLGSTDFSYAARVERSRFQYLGRSAMERAIWRWTNWCAPSINLSARSPSQVSGCVPGRLSTAAAGAGLSRVGTASVILNSWSNSRRVIMVFSRSCALHSANLNLFRMTLQEFRDSVAREEPPRQLSLALAGLWWDAKGDW